MRFERDCVGISVRSKPDLPLTLEEGRDFYEGKEDQLYGYRDAADFLNRHGLDPFSPAEAACDVAVPIAKAA